MENGLGLYSLDIPADVVGGCVCGGGRSHSVCVVCGVCVWGGAVIVCVCVCVVWCVWGGCSHSVCIGTLVIIQARTCYSS